MPRYWFCLTDGEEVLENPKGLELPGDAAALDEAVVLARELKEGKVVPGRNWDGWFVDIQNEHGESIDTVPIDIAPEEPSLG